jgi:hypothetical protein
MAVPLYCVLKSYIIKQFCIHQIKIATLTLALLFSNDSRQGPVVGSCEHSTETFGSIKGEKFLSQMTFWRMTLLYRFN